MKSGRGHLVRRSASEWAARFLLALAVLVLGYLGVTRTLASALREGDPARAYAMSSENGRIAGALAQRLSGVDATSEDRVRADRLAWKALRSDPTAIAAVTTLGINAQVRGDVTSARRLFAYAERLSRRDLQTQLFAIEDAVGRGDVSGALRHYDIALRTSRGAPDLLFPVLGAAIAEPPIRTALARTLAGNPSWGADFIRYVAGSGSNPLATVQLFHALGRVGIAVPDEARAAVIGALVSRDLIKPAWSYYASAGKGSDPRRSRDPDFKADPSNPSLFDWVPINDAGVSASIEQAGPRGVVDFTAVASVGGPMLQQMQVLPPGDYALEGRSEGIEQSEIALPYWSLTCRGGRELGRVTVPNSAQHGGRFKGRFAVPAGCPVQTLTLVARPSDAVAGLSGQIHRAQLSPARESVEADKQ